VQQLEVQADHARREATQAIAAAAQRLATPAPAAPPYVIVVAQPPPAPAQPPPMGPCDYAWGNCGWGLWPGFYSPGYVVVNEGRHHHRHPHRPAHHHAPLRDPGYFTAPPAVHPYPFPTPKPTSWRK
jgi:hypothetical protein